MSGSNITYRGHSLKQSGERKEGGLHRASRLQGIFDKNGHNDTLHRVCVMHNTCSGHFHLETFWRLIKIGSGRVQVVCLSHKEYCSPASLLRVQGQPAHLGTSESLLGSFDPLSCSLELFFASVQPLAILPTKAAPFSAATSSS